jgi:hypothetical protein
VPERTARRTADGGRVECTREKLAIRLVGLPVDDGIYENTCGLQ